jgi:hypothetical protein
MKRKRWEDLSPGQQAAIMIVGSIQILLLILALWDIRKRPAEALTGSKAMWALISFINILGPLAYFLFGRKRMPDQTQYIVLQEGLEKP